MAICILQELATLFLRLHGVHVVCVHLLRQARFHNDVLMGMNKRCFILVRLATSHYHQMKMNPGSCLLLSFCQQVHDGQQLVGIHNLNP